MSDRETSTSRMYVYHGWCDIITEDGVRGDISGDDPDLARSFLASEYWIAQHHKITRALELECDYIARLKAEEDAKKPAPKKRTRKPRAK